MSLVFKRSLTLFFAFMVISTIFCGAEAQMTGSKIRPTVHDPIFEPDTEIFVAEVEKVSSEIKVQKRSLEDPLLRSEEKVDHFVGTVNFQLNAHDYLFPKNVEEPENPKPVVAEVIFDLLNYPEDSADRSAVRERLERELELFPQDGVHIFRIFRDRDGITRLHSFCSIDDLESVKSSLGP